MDTNVVTLSPKYQVVIPLAVRRALGLKPGEKLRVFPYAGRVEMIVVRPVKEMRGALRGLDTRLDRERDRP
ncbi:MAG: AbrB/MazE/SpoVT family DNA-binding domain-containing protein [Planctomycetes bacterium]|nr:AbrB/MazE/SpoVT family DNA-binding domain-containing protein [Planctomycetota bacterium]